MSDSFSDYIFGNNVFLFRWSDKVKILVDGYGMMMQGGIGYMEIDIIVSDTDSINKVKSWYPGEIFYPSSAIDKIEIGQILKVEADDPAAEEDIKRWAKRTGHEILSFEKEGTIMTFFIKRMK